MRVVDVRPGDWPAVWPIVAEVVRAADTYALDPAMTETEAQSLWIESPPGRTTVAIDETTGAVAGTATMGPNRPGPGDHVATGGFMVAAAERGRGVGRRLVIDALGWARTQGYRGMQFNAVTETNHGAVALYRDLGFSIVGTVPGAFRHPGEGYVGLHVMYADLTGGSGLTT